MNHPHAFRSLRVAVLALTCASGLTFTSCYQMPTRRGVTVETTSTGKLEQKNPLDIVVAPIENASGNARVPVEDLRAAFQLGLVKRRYSPLSLESVDKQVIDEVYTAGALHEDADLRVKIESWNDSLWETHTALIIKAEVRMVDTQDPSAGDLWTGKVNHRYEFGPYRDKYSSDQALLQFACNEIVSEILSALPARSTAPGTMAPKN